MYRLAVCFVIVLLSTYSNVYAGSHEYLYSPPFLPGKQFLIVQGFNGNYSHNTPIARYAVDLAMPLGEFVCAAREGIVSDLYDGNDEHKSHFVYLLHDDQTIGDYEHLLAGSISVSIGQIIKQGECFAKSGNTGNSSGPHLHFAILQKKGLFKKTFISIPFYFNDAATKVMPVYLNWLKN